MKPVSSTGFTMSNSNFYSFEGRAVPRVSAILQHCEDRTGLFLWQQRVGVEEANKIRDAAARLGTKIHKALELERTDSDKFAAFTSTFSKKELGMLENYVDFRKSFSVSYAERKLHYFDSVTLQEYAGTPDAIGTITSNFYNRKGDLVLPVNSKVVADYKNYAKQKHIKWLTKGFLQLSAYSHAIHSVSTARLNGCILATCSPRQLNLYFMDSELTNYYAQLFLSCLEHYYAKSEFDWDGMLSELGYEEMMVTDWSKLPERIYYENQLEELNEKAEKRKLNKMFKIKDELKEFTLF